MIHEFVNISLEVFKIIMVSFISHQENLQLIT